MHRARRQAGASRSIGLRPVRARHAAAQGGALTRQASPRRRPLHALRSTGRSAPPERRERRTLHVLAIRAGPLRSSDCRTVEASNYWTGAERTRSGSCGDRDAWLAARGCREQGRPTADPFDPANRVDAASRDTRPTLLHLNCGRSGGRSRAVRRGPTPALVIYAAESCCGTTYRPRIPASTGRSSALGICETPSRSRSSDSTGGADYAAVALEVDGRRVTEERFQAELLTLPGAIHPASALCARGQSRPSAWTRGGSRTAAHSLRVLVRDAAGNVTASRSLLDRRQQRRCVVSVWKWAEAEGWVWSAQDRGARSRSPLTDGRWSAGGCSRRSGSAQGGRSGQGARRGAAGRRSGSRSRIRPRGGMVASAPGCRRGRRGWCGSRTAGRDGGHYRDLRLRAKPSVGSSREPAAGSQRARASSFRGRRSVEALSRRAASSSSSRRSSAAGGGPSRRSIRTAGGRSASVTGSAALRARCATASGRACLVRAATPTRQAPLDGSR